MKTLKQICEELTGIEMGLMQGSVGFRYAAPAAVGKAGHPVEIMDDMLNPINYEVRHGRTPERGTVNKTLVKLRKFREAFEIEELDGPLADLGAWLRVTDPAE